MECEPPVVASIILELLLFFIRFLTNLAFYTRQMTFCILDCFILPSLLKCIKLRT